MLTSWIPNFEAEKARNQGFEMDQLLTTYRQCLVNIKHIPKEGGGIRVDSDITPPMAGQTWMGSGKYGQGQPIQQPPQQPDTSFNFGANAPSEAPTPPQGTLTPQAPVQAPQQPPTAPPGAPQADIDQAFGIPASDPATEEPQQGTQQPIKPGETW